MSRSPSAGVSLGDVSLVSEGVGEEVPKILPRKHSLLRRSRAVAKMRHPGKPKQTIGSVHYAWCNTTALTSNVDAETEQVIMLHPQEALAGETGLDDKALHICTDGARLELEYVREIYGKLAAVPCLWVRR